MLCSLCFRDIKLENVMLARVRSGDISVPRVAGLGYVMRRWLSTEIKLIDFDTIQPLSKAGHITTLGSVSL